MRSDNHIHQFYHFKPCLLHLQMQTQQANRNTMWLSPFVTMIVHRRHPQTHVKKNQIYYSVQIARLCFSGRNVTFPPFFQRSALTLSKFWALNEEQTKCHFLSDLAIPKRLIPWKFCVWCLCVFSVNLCQDCICGFWIISGLMTCVQSK